MVSQTRRECEYRYRAFPLGVLSRQQLCLEVFHSLIVFHAVLDGMYLSLTLLSRP